MKRHFLILLLVFTLVGFKGCSDQSLVNLSRALNDVAHGVLGLQNIIIQGQAQGQIPTETASRLLTLCMQISMAGKQADTMTRNLTKLSPADRTNVLSVVQPVLDAVTFAITSDAPPLGLQPPIRENVILMLQAIQTALNTARAIVATQGGK